MTEIKLNKIDDFRWEIPVGTIPNMKVPGLVFATERMLEKMKQDRTLLQAAGVATLPGIYKHAIVLPDGHEGYGFPIGGVAALDFKEGGISPGGIGYDINCLAAGTRVLTEFGYWNPVEDFEPRTTEIESSGFKAKMNLSETRLVSFDAHEFKRGEILMFMHKEAPQKMLKITTATGFNITVSPDHPLLTRRGMVKADEIDGDDVMINPFQGVEYESFSDEKTEMRTAIFAKLIGYLIGDGLVYFSGKKAFVCAYGKRKDLEEMRADIEKLGYKAHLYDRDRAHEIHGRKFNSKTCELHVNSPELARKLAELGMPTGKKTDLDFGVPEWIMKSKKWIKRLFLSAFFGAEMSKPRTHTKTGFDSPVVSQNKSNPTARRLLVDVMRLLEEFGIKSGIKTLKEYESWRTKLTVQSKEENLLKLWRNVGYSYNKERSRLANLTAFYILKKKAEYEQHASLDRRIKDMRRAGLRLREVQRILGDQINERFIERHYYEKAGHRISLDFISFNEFAERGELYDDIKNVEEVKYNGLVYDFNVNGFHNFVANGIVVSNCGVRLLTTNLTVKDVTPKLKELLESMFRNVPSGLGSKGKVKLTRDELDQLLEKGAGWAVEKGYGWAADLEHLESNGCMEADASIVSKEAKSRGVPQQGSLGSGNHFLEIEKVDKIFNPETAEAFGIHDKDQIVVMIHTGSRGLGHQVCSDFLKEMEREFHSIIEKLPDRELVYAPAGTDVARRYLLGMGCAANFAWANRQMIVHWVRESFEKTFKRPAEELGMNIIYDVAHNICKVEEHEIDGRKVKCYLHRKGGTRAFPPHHPEIPADYRPYGQPVLLPGSMGTASYVLVGTKEGMKESFGSTAHGAGRQMSRHEALRQYRGETVQKELAGKGILVRGASWQGIAEEAPGAYKDIDEVARVSHETGIARMVARQVPIGVVKG